MAANEEQLLRQFQVTGSREALRELLVVHQDRIYNACFQVLGRAEDAEDAAQEALLKLAEGARSARDADAFRGWIYRVSIRIALDHWRRREAVKNRETRAAMNRPSVPPLDDRERVALFEAMDGLDDRERSLLLEHYFEKVPLANLGERRGISAVAIWKRIDKAREKLKKSLLGAGFAAASDRVGNELESTVPALTPPTLIAEALVSKLLSGGLVMAATKSALVPLTLIVTVVFLAASAIGYVLHSSRVVERDGSEAARIGAGSGSGDASSNLGEGTSGPGGPTPSGLSVQDEVVRLLHQMVEAIGRSDDAAVTLIQKRLQRIGLRAVAPMREDVLANPDTRHRSQRFLLAIRETLVALDAPEVGAELLESWRDLDQKKYDVYYRSEDSLLGQFAEVIARNPPAEARTSIADLYASAKKPMIRKSLIDLMGLLLKRVAGMREDLQRIMVEDGDASVRAAAVAALAAQEGVGFLPTALLRLESLLSEGGDRASAELWNLTESLVKALPVDQALDRLREQVEKAGGRNLSSRLNSVGLGLGFACAAPGGPGWEIVLGRAVGEKSSHMQLVYLGAIIAMHQNPDARATDLAEKYLDSSSDDGVRCHALSMITALNRDEPTVLGAIDRMVGKSNQVTASAGMQLSFYFYTKNPNSTAALDLIRKHVTRGDIETRVAILKNLRMSSRPIPASVQDIIRPLSESDADATIRETASEVLRWDGWPAR